MQSSLFAPSPEAPVDVLPTVSQNGLPACVWRADALGSRPAEVVSSGFASLDRELPGGGWPRGSLTEILPQQPGAGEMRLLLPALAAVSRARQPTIILSPPHRLLAPPFAHAGVDVDQLLIVRVDRPGDALWCAEQALKARHAGAVLGWFPSARPEHLRRLQLAASGSECLLFVFRPVEVQFDASPAPLRIRCEPGPDGGIVVDIFKRRGPPAPAVSVPGRLHRALERAIERASRRRRSSPIPVDHVLDSRRSSPVAA